MNCEFVNPLLDPDWNTLILRYSGATVFHSAQWAQVLAESYRYRPVYAVITDAQTTLGVLPVMEVKSLWTGKRGVCLPFTDECSALLSEGATPLDLIEPIRSLGMEKGWDYLELRGGAAGVPLAKQSDAFVAHHLTLESSGEDVQFGKLRDSTRRNIQKAIREGVEIQHLETRDAIDIFYSLHCKTRRRHGLPPQPVRFFHLIHKLLIEAGLGFVSLARFGGQWIAGAVYFRFGSQSIYKFGASDPAFQHLRANNLLMWRAICELRKAGMKELSLGRSDPRDPGLLQFKRGWGGRETLLEYHRIGLRKQSGVSKAQQDSAPGFSHRIARRLPVPLLRLLGSLLYRHVG